ncbi:MAG: hypothetical protein Q8Q14_01765 [Gemmatimonadales bacterium]|nr:hypothetical protein [Gemmatimonadales bacterium]
MILALRLVLQGQTPLTIGPVAPFAGRMLYVVATPAISAGEPLGMVGEPKP